MTSQFVFTLDVGGEIRGKLSIGTATLNSLGLKDKASLMPRGEKRAEIAPTLQAPSPPPRETYYTSFADIWWFYRLKQLVKLSKSTQFCLPFCKVLNFCCVTLAKIMYKLTSVFTSYVSIISDKLLCKILLSDKKLCFPAQPSKSSCSAVRTLGTS